MLRRTRPNRLRRSELKAVARLHRDNLDQSFLATLGTGFLTEMYLAISRTPDAVLLIEKDADGAVIGFVSGARGMGAIYKRMMTRFYILPFVLAPALLNPRKVARILEILRYSGGSSDQGEVSLPASELLSIAVAPAARGTGASTRLYQRLCAHFRDSGEPSFRIVVGASLAAAHRFYLRMGAEAVREIEVHKGERSTVYVHRLDDVPGALSPAG